MVYVQDQTQREHEKLHDSEIIDRRFDLGELGTFDKSLDELSLEVR